MNQLDTRLISLDRVARILREAKVAARGHTAEQSAVAGVVIRITRTIAPDLRKQFLIDCDQYEESYWVLDEEEYTK